MTEYKEKNPYVIEYLRTRDPALREVILREYSDIIEAIAKKFAFNVSDYDDLVQIASMALVKALDRFDISKGTSFSTFFSPNIIGEVKHYFRDKSNTIKVPRLLHELHTKINQILRQAESNHQPISTKEIAERLNTTEERVLEAMEASQNTKVLSIDAPFKSNADANSTQSIGDSIGDNYTDEKSLNKEMLQKAVSRLKKREQDIIYLRFYEGLSQAEIAQRVGLSQMHISRLLSQSIKQLRTWTVL